MSIPAHKVIPGTGGSIAVDAFRHAQPGIKAYFLTHAHSDHYAGLSEHWSAGPVYCSEVTARLVVHLTGLDPRYVHPLPMEQPVQVAGVEVTLVDANHCPGAVQLLFRLPPPGPAGGAASPALPTAPAVPTNGTPTNGPAATAGSVGTTLDRAGSTGGGAGGGGGARYLHCGDMRFSPAMTSCPHLAAWRGCEAVFLDTTYCHPRHTFPRQEEAVAYVVRTLAALLAEDAKQEAAAAGQEAAAEGAEGAPAGRNAPQPGAGASQDLGGAGADGAGGDAAAAGAAGEAPDDARGAAEVAQLDATAAASAEADAHGGIRDGSDAGAGAEGGAGGGQLDESAIGSGGSGGPFRRLYLVSTYVIGKERILMAIRQHCGVKVYVPETKLAVLALAGMSERALADTFTTDPRATPVHVVGWGSLGDTWPFFRPNFAGMQRTAEEMGARSVVGFCPTGWLYEMRRSAFPVRTRGSLSVHLVPYSEHSSFAELREYVRWLRPQQVIPTVGVGGDDGERNRAAMLKHFASLVDGTARKARFLAGMRGRAAAAAGAGAGAGRPAGASARAATAGAVACPAAGAAPALTAETVNGEDGAAAGDVIVIDDDSDCSGADTGAAGEGEGVGGDAAHAGGCGGAAAAAGTCSAAGTLELEQEPGQRLEVRQRDADPDPERRPDSPAQEVKPSPHGDNQAAGGDQAPQPEHVREQPPETGDVQQQQRPDAPPGPLQQLLAVLGGAASRDRAEALLAAARGDVAAALNAFFDGSTGGGSGAGGGGGERRGPLSSAAGGRSGGRRHARGSSGGGRQGGGRGSAGGSSKTPASQGGEAPASQARPAKRPRLGAPAGSQASQGGAGAGGQRSITAFLGGRTSAASASASQKSAGGGSAVPQEGAGRPVGGSSGAGDMSAAPPPAAAGVKLEPGASSVVAPSGPAQHQQPAQATAPAAPSVVAPAGNGIDAPHVKAEAGQVNAGRPPVVHTASSAGVVRGGACAEGFRPASSSGAGVQPPRSLPGTGPAPHAVQLQGGPAVARSAASGDGHEGEEHQPAAGAAGTSPPAAQPPAAKRPRLQLPRYSPVGTVQGLAPVSPPPQGQVPAQSTGEPPPQPQPQMPAEAPDEGGPAAEVEASGDGRDADGSTGGSRPAAAAPSSEQPSIPQAIGQQAEPQSQPQSQSQHLPSPSRSQPLHPFFATRRATASMPSPATRGRDRGGSRAGSGAAASPGRAHGRGSAAGRAPGGSDPHGAAPLVPAGGEAAAASLEGPDGVTAPRASREGDASLAARDAARAEAGEHEAARGVDVQAEAGGEAAATPPPAEGAARPHPAQPASGPPLPTASTSAPASGSVSWEDAQRALLLPPARYDPARHACWATNTPSPSSSTTTPSPAPAPGTGPTPYAHVAACLAALESTTKRLAKEDALTNTFRAVLARSADPRVDLVSALYLLTGRIAPEHERLELNVGGATVSAALMGATGASAGRLRQLYRELGDLGDVAQACRRTQSTLRRPAPLLAARLLAQLRALAADKGAGVAGRRQAAVLGLLRACREGEVKYLTRTLISNLRVGANWRSVLGPLGRAALIHMRATAATGTPAASAALPGKAELDAAASAVVSAYHLCPCFELLVPALLEGGPAGLADRCVLTPGVPIKPMLAKICGGVRDGLRQLGPPGAPFLAEYKYDGVRAQIHLMPGGQVRIFSRNCEDRTDAFPDVCALIRAAAGLTAPPAAAAAADAGAAGAGAGQSGDAEAVGGAPQAGACVSPPPPPEASTATGVSDAAAVPTSSCVLDAEVVAVEWLQPGEGQAGGQGQGSNGGVGDASSGGGGEGPPAPPYRLRAFQELATRARGQVEEHEVTVRVCVFVFDLIYWNGTSLLQRPLRERRTLLRAALPGMSPGRVMLATAAEMQPLTPAPPLQQQQQQQQQQAEPAAAAAPAPGNKGRRKQLAAPKVAAVAAANAAEGPEGSGSSGEDEEAAAAALCAVRLWPAPGEAGARRVLPDTDRPVGAAAPQPPQHTTSTDRAATEADGEAVVDLVDSDGPDSPARPGVHPGAAAAEGPGAPAAQQRNGRRAAASTTAAAGNGGDCGGASGGAAAGPQSGGSGVEAAGAVCSAEEAVHEMLLQSLNAGAEGLMLKRLDGGAGYEPSRRSESWIKLKRDYCEGLRDSVDVVPIGAWYGQGRKVKWFSPFLLAVYDPVSETFQSLCRCMSGFSDEFYAAARERLGATAIPGPKPYYDTSERPSVWFEPTEVWELRGADLTLSPVHRAAAGRLHPERGVGMRFPRFIRTRDDKRPEDATSAEQVAELYGKQTRKVAPPGAGAAAGAGGNGAKAGPSRQGQRQAAGGRASAAAVGSGGAAARAAGQGGVCGRGSEGAEDAGEEEGREGEDPEAEAEAEWSDHEGSS